MIEPVQDTRVNGRANQIRFPDGRLLTVVGHQHGDRQVYEMGLAKDKVAALPTPAFEAAVRATLKKNNEIARDANNWEKIPPMFAMKFGLKPMDIAQMGLLSGIGRGQFESVLVNAQQDESYLLSRLKSTVDQPKFIGLEAYKPGIQDEMRESYRFVQSEFARRGSELTLSEQEMKDFLLSGSMGNVHAYIENPKLREIAPLVNIEGPAALPVQRDSDREVKAFTEMIEANQKYLQALTPERRAEAKVELARFVKTLVEVTQAYDSRMRGGESADQLADRLQSTVPHWLTKQGASLVEFLRSFGLSVQERDHQAAFNMVSLKQTGIYFVGRLHLGPLSHNLVAMCQAELNGGSVKPVRSDDLQKPTTIQ